MSQLQQLTTLVIDLQTRVDNSDRRYFETVMMVRPPPAPPFSQSTATPSSNSTPLFTYSPTPSAGANFTTQHTAHSLGFSSPQLSLGLPGPLTMPFSAAPHSAPPFGYTDAISAVASSSRPPPPLTQPWLHYQFIARGSDRTPLRRPQMVNPASCWGPPSQRPQFGTLNPNQHYNKVRMEPTHFDGTKVNNQIRVVHFYFNHIGTPEAQRLHYVIMLFEPMVANWIWNFCTMSAILTPIATPATWSPQQASQNKYSF